MHILDLIMYPVTLALLFLLMRLLLSGEELRESEYFMMLGVAVVYTIAYIILFCFYPDWNWIDIFKGKYSLPFTITW